MKNSTTQKSVSLVTLLLLSTMTGLIVLPTASAINETSSGTITGTETWSGTHNLNGDVVVAEGAKLIVNAGTTVNIPYGNHIDVAGAICIGDSSCGASIGSSSSQARFIWSTPSDYKITGSCYSNNTNDPNYNTDTACGSGMIIRSTIDQAITSIRYAHFENAYGIPFDVNQLTTKSYGVLVFDGSSTTAEGLSFQNINTSNVLAIDLAAPVIFDSTFVVGDDANGYAAASVLAYGAGAGILSTMQIRDSVFSGDTESECNQQGLNLINIEDSYIDMSNLELKENSYGLYMEQSSGSVTNSTITVKCSGINTNSHKVTGTINHSLMVADNVITTETGAGITAYDGAIVQAHRNTISGAAEGSGFDIKSSTVTANNNQIGPIGGWNGFWIYGESDVVAENNTIQDTAKEPVLIGEYHYRDQNWNVPPPSAARLYLANNQISNNTGTCNSVKMYGGDFPCPAIHVFMSSATLYDNTVTNNAGDGLRIKAGIVNAQRNTIEVGGFAANVSLYDDPITKDKFGSIAYFSGNTYTNASQVYNITESRVTVQSEYIPDAGGNELYPVQMRWLGPECPYVLDECLQVPPTAILPPAFMPLALEVVENSTVFSYADLQNFDSSKIHVQNQNSAWGSQVREGELVRYQVKAQNSNVYDATVIIRDATGLPLYTMQTDAFGFTPEVSLPSDFLLDRNWNHNVGETNVQIPGVTDENGNDVFIDENSCADGYDNDGDTKYDSEDSDCNGGRELPFYSVEAFKFGKGENDLDFVLSGSIDDVINLVNLKPSVTVNQNDGFSFATVVTLTGTSWDGISGPYPLDEVAYQNQFGLIKRIEILPPGESDWNNAGYAVDTSGANGEITLANHPFKTWSFDWDMAAHPEGEGDVTFRVRSFDGLDYSPVEVRKYKLNLVAPTILVNSPTDGSSHETGKVTFTGTASDPYTGTWGSDINSIWFDVNGPNGYTSNFQVPGSTAWAYDWIFQDLQTGQYDFRIWASDSDFCNIKTGWSECAYESRTININTDNAIPFVQLSEPLNADTLRASETQLIQGVALDNDGLVTRVEISIFDLASGIALNNGPIPVTNFAPNGAWYTTWDTSKLIHDQQYELVIKAWDGKDFSNEERIRITIDNPTDAENEVPRFNSSGWAKTITLFCDSNPSKADRCNGGISIDLMEHFSDPDGIIDGKTDGLTFDIFDDNTNLDDDFYGDYITLSDRGVASYNPAFVNSLGNEVSEWSLVGLMFEARDAYDSVAYSVPLNVVVVEISFTVIRDGSGPIGPDSPAYFSGQGLPNSLVEARFDSLKGIRINQTRVNADATWSMEISSSQLSGMEGTSEIIFEMDDQVYVAPGDNSDTLFQLSVGGDSESGLNLGLIAAIVVGIIILLGAGMFFFQVEYEDLDEDDELSEQQVAAVDPYAWAKARKEPVAIPTPAAAATPQAAAQALGATATQAVTPQASQHPGWLWDAESNNWVPDPNYKPGQ
ncbi:MAG: right-handed parallel beta-helix repeat-containing protein [Candidatus Poseidoniales archaeon]|nr:MAG: right-handed parallel beta-helix repeat-containing protein [Candidatus Poseidoniales archaeon]